ncbi:period circadian protein isoform X2 [Myzus persicae]|uniref:period circadian protein isoform X2 n=1 Tax=Myzus persicae TaxID=13164 RepID=UPI000B932B1A|nr:period circadian protein isoform X2 [Myzus persicae]
MEESKSFSVNQTRTDYDSGYSCTSTQSKYSVKSQLQEPSTESSFEEQSLTILTTDADREMSTVNSKLVEQSSQTILRGLNTNPKPSTTCSKSKQKNSTTYKPQTNQLCIDASTSKMESDDLNNDIKVDHSQENMAFLQLSYLCQSYRDINQINSTSNPTNTLTIIDTVLKVLKDQDIQFNEIIESDDVQNDSFGVVVSMTDGLIIDISNSINKSMGYPKDMWKNRSFIDFIHPKDRMTFVNYITSILTDPCMITRADGVSAVTYLRPKTNDGFYCNMGYSISETENYYKVCKLTITFKDLSHVSTTQNMTQLARPQLFLVVKSQLIHSAYICPEEKIENPTQFITKHNAFFEWCYVDKLITSYFGYLPQNFIGRSIFDYYCIEDLTTIKEIHANMIKAKSITLKGNPYRFKCQNGDFALVQTEWSTFVNPWSGRVEFVIGKHKIIQGPINPDVTTLADNTIPEDTETKVEYGLNKTPTNFNRTNKNKEVAEVSYEINQTMDTNSKKQIAMEYKDLTECMNCFVHPSIQVPLNDDVQPEMSGNYSDHDSPSLSQHHNNESKSSSDTLLSYTELNYNDNIQRFFNSKVKTNSSEDSSCSKKFAAREVTSFEKDTTKVQPDTIPLSQCGTPILNRTVTQNSPSYDSEQCASKNCQLTQKMLLRHNEKMECDLVKQHKQNKSSKKQNFSNQAIYISDIAHGIKRNNSTANENKSFKLSKRKCLSNSSGPTNVTQPFKHQDIAATPTVARATQIWSFCQITRDSQTMTDLPPIQPQALPGSCQKLVLPSQALIVPCQPLIYNVPLSNNVMPVQNKCNFMDMKFGNNQETLSNKLQSLSMPSHITENPQLLHMEQQLHIQQLYQNIENKNEASIQSGNSDQNIRKKTKASQVNQEEVMTSSDSDFKRETGSLKSSGWMYEDSSYYSSSLREKTDSSEREDFPLLNVYEKTNCSHQLIKKQPFWMEDIVTTPDLVYRYQMDYGDVNEVLRKDMNTLNTFTQVNKPMLVNEQLKQLCVEIDVNGSSKTSYFEDGTSSSSDGDECYISIGKNKRRRIDFCRMAMIYEEDALIPPPTTSPRNKLPKSDQSTS